MRNGLRILLLLAVLTVVIGIGDLSAGKPGLICGTPDDPIPCSTFDTEQCSYTYHRASNCCVPSSGFPCLGICC